MKLRNISPTEFEKTTLGLPESTENERVNKVASGDVHLSDEDTSNPPPQASRKQLKTKRKPPLNNDDWSTELKRLSDGQLELKSELQMVWIFSVFLLLTFEFSYINGRLTLFLCFTSSTRR